MSKPNLPPLPPVPEKQPSDDDSDDYWTESDFERYATSYAEEAVRQALAAQVAKINEAVASMSAYEVSASAIRKEYFKAGARRVIQAVNSALIPEKDHG